MDVELHLLLVKLLFHVLESIDTLVVLFFQFHDLGFEALRLLLPLVRLHLHLLQLRLRLLQLALEEISGRLGIFQVLQVPVLG